MINLPFKKSAVVLAFLLIGSCGGGGGGGGGSGTPPGGGSGGIPPLTNGFEVWDSAYAPAVGQAGKLCMAFSAGASAGQIGASRLFVNGYLEASDLAGTVDSAGNVAMSSIVFPVQFSALVDAAATNLFGTFSGTSAIGSGSFSGGRVTGKFGCFWERFGTPGALDVASANNAFTPAIAVNAQNRPVVAFVEEVLGTPVGGSTPFEDKLYVKRWDGAQWVQLGGSLNTGNNDVTYQPHVALDASGNPVVAWSERNKLSLVDEAYVKRWNGASWDSLGGLLNNLASQLTRNQGVIVDAGGNPVVALSYLNAMTQFDTRVMKWDGVSAAWVQLGSTLLDAFVHDLKNNPADGNPVAVYQDSVNPLFAARWDGATWASLGIGSIVTTVGPVASAVLAYSAGAPVVVYDYNPGGGSKLAAMTVVSSAWAQLIPGVSFDPFGNKMTPQIAVDPTDNRVVVAAATNSTGGIVVKKALADRWKQVGELSDHNLFSVASPALAFDGTGRLFAAQSQAATAGNRDIVVNSWPTPN